MSKEKEIEYMRCHNCGKYIIAEDAYKGQYCTLACSTDYSKCIICGSFYVTKKGFSEEYCSGKCADIIKTETKDLT